MSIVKVMVQFQVMRIRMAENDDLSSLIENSVASDMPIIISDKKGKDVGVVSQKDLLVSIVEGQDE